MYLVWIVAIAALIAMLVVELSRKDLALADVWSALKAEDLMVVHAPTDRIKPVDMHATVECITALKNHRLTVVYRRTKKIDTIVENFQIILREGGIIRERVIDCVDWGIIHLPNTDARRNDYQERFYAQLIIRRVRERLPASR